MANSILLIEGNAADATMTIGSLRETNIKNEIVHCNTGEEALDYLHRRDMYSEQGAAEKPSLILLDLNLPGIDGWEVLRDIRSDAKLMLIPVIVLTTSSDKRDIDNCYEYGANSYVVKPVGFEGFIHAMARLTGYWLEIAVIPK